MAIDFKGTKIEDAPDNAIPICPNCKEKLDTIWSKGKWKLTGARDILMCPNCKVFLGYGIARG